MTELRRARFWFLRHGQTDWNAANKAQGDVDIPLNALGEQQARDASALLPGKGIASIVCSTLGRARATALVASATLGLPVTYDDRLREASFGERDGTPMNEAWFAEWVEGIATPALAESFAALRERAVGAVNVALAQPPLVLIVGHGAFFRALRAAMGLAPNVRTQNAIPILCVPPGDGETAWRLEPAGETPI